MGWKTFFKMTSNDFKTYHEQEKKWGDFNPIKFVLESEEIYSVGLYGMPSEGSEIKGSSPRIACPVGTQLRITVKLIFFMDAGTPTSCEGAIFIFPHKNGELASDAGYGATFPVKRTPSVNTAEFHEFIVEMDGGQLTITLDEYKFAPVPLKAPVQSFDFLIALRRYYVASESAEKPVENPAEPQQQDGFALAIYEITGEYYDQWEDLFNMITQILYISMFIMFGVMVVTMIIRMFRSKKRRGEMTGGE